VFPEVPDGTQLHLSASIARPHAHFVPVSPPAPVNAFSMTVYTI